MDWCRQTRRANSGGIWINNWAFTTYFQIWSKPVPPEKIDETPKMNRRATDHFRSDFVFVIGAILFFVCPVYPGLAWFLIARGSFAPRFELSLIYSLIPGAIVLSIAMLLRLRENSSAE